MVHKSSPSWGLRVMRRSLLDRSFWNFKWVGKRQTSWLCTFKIRAAGFWRKAWHMQRHATIWWIRTFFCTDMHVCQLALVPCAKPEREMEVPTWHTNPLPVGLLGEGRCHSSASFGWFVGLRGATNGGKHRKAFKNASLQACHYFGRVWPIAVVITSILQRIHRGCDLPLPSLTSRNVGLGRSGGGSFGSTFDHGRLPRWGGEIYEVPWC